MAASSAQHSAPLIVITPASAQATNNQPGEPTSRDDSAEVMKMPDPIIDPITIIVPSVKPRPRTNFGDSVLISAMMLSAYYRDCRQKSIHYEVSTESGSDRVIPKATS